LRSKHRRSARCSAQFPRTTCNGAKDRHHSQAGCATPGARQPHLPTTMSIV
jgi:hypothetical protein